MDVLDLFSGIGGFSLGLHRAGFNTVAFCEIDKFCQKVLAKNFPDVPIYSDITTIREELKLERPIGLLCGGYPCQPFSNAGLKKGEEDDRYLLLASKHTNHVGLLERMLLTTSIWASTLCFLTWRVRATPQQRLLYQLVPSTPLTDETDCGLWLTPTATNIGERSEEAMQKRKEYRESIGRTTVPPGGLAEQVRAGKPTTNMLPTPTARDWKDCGANINLYRHRRQDSQLGVVVMRESEDSGSLNPTWVEWLMGFPIGWTDLEH